MKVLFLTTILFLTKLAVCQHTYLIANAQLTPFLNEKTILSDYEFQINSRIGVAGYIPFYYDTLKNREWVGLEFGLGTFFNSFYYTKSGNEYASKSYSYNSVPGAFLNVEPYFNFFQDKNNRFAAHASMNVVMYFYDGSGVSSEMEMDSSRFEQATDKPQNIFQIGLEPNIGLSYLFPIHSGGGLLFRLKGGLVVHNQEVAQLSLSNSNETANVKMNDYLITFSIGWRLNSKK